MHVEERVAHDLKPWKRVGWSKTRAPGSFEGSELKTTEGPRLLNLPDVREESFLCCFRTLSID